MDAKLGLSQKSLTESLERLECKTGKCPFFKVQTDGITVCHPYTAYIALCKKEGSGETIEEGATRIQLFNIELWLNLAFIKGQLILRCPFGVFKSFKKAMKSFPGFLP